MSNFTLPEQFINDDGVKRNFSAITRYLNGAYSTTRLSLRGGTGDDCSIRYDGASKKLLATVNGVTKTIADWSV